MARLVAKHAPAALVAALLVATALAFVYTEKLKLTLSPILGTKVDKVLSPVCDCETSAAAISFRLRKGDRIIGTAEFCRLANFNRSTLHRKIRHNEPDFPRPIRTCKV